MVICGGKVLDRPEQNSYISVLFLSCLVMLSLTLNIVLLLFNLKVCAFFQVVAFCVNIWFVLGMLQPTFFASNIDSDT